MVATLTAIGSKRYPADAKALRALAARCYDRGVDPRSASRQLAAIQTAPDRTAKLRRLQVPTTVIHGSNDPLIMPSGGRATAQAIPGARLVIFEGMGHNLPRQLWPQIIDTILQNVAAGAPSAPAPS
jgi:pimeloyl-ACP methyl ester carboxylesterase